MASTTPAKLTYFKGRGRAQQPRWALAAAGVPFVNVWLDVPEDMDALRASGKSMYGQVPLLELPDGECRVQSMAIVRYAARVGDLYGTSIREASIIDELLDGITDARGPLVGYPFLDTDDAAEKIKANVGRYFPIFEKSLESNASPPFAVGSKLTIADVLLVELYEYCLEFSADFYGKDNSFKQKLMDDFPKMRALYEHVNALPQIKEFKGSSNWTPFPVKRLGVEEAGAEVAKEYVHNVNSVLRR